MEQIVVGIDPGSAGERALDRALLEAVARRVPLRAVRAWSPTPGLYTSALLEPAAPEPAPREDAQRLAETMLEAARERVAGSDAVDVQAVVVLGPPGEVLVEVAGEVSLLVVGTRGGGALSRAVLGSVSASVLHRARCPVAVVPAHAVVATATSRVLVGVDHSAASHWALSVAVEQARVHASHLVPLFVRDPLLLSPEFGVQDPRSLEASEREALLEAARAAGAQGIPVEPDVLTGHPAAELRRAARPDDVLVVGSRGRGGLTGLLLGSTSAHLAQHAPCTVVVVRSAPAPAPADDDLEAALA